MPGITAYELALIFFSAGWLDADCETYNKLPENIKRYYKKESK